MRKYRSDRDKLALKAKRGSTSFDVKENWTDMRPKNLHEKMDILLNN